MTPSDDTTLNIQSVVMTWEYKMNFEKWISGRKETKGLTKTPKVCKWIKTPSQIFSKIAPPAPDQDTKI